MKIFGTVGENDFKWWRFLGVFVFLVSVFSFINLFNRIGYFHPILLFYIFGMLIGGFMLILNKYAFLIYIFLQIIYILISPPSLFLSYIVILPFIIFNIVYLINRWCHPKVNEGKACGEYAEELALKRFKEEIQ